MRWRCVDERLVDRARSIWHESRSHHDLGSPMCSFAMRRSPIITAHAKMQFKLQVHVVSRSRQGRRFRARLDAAGRFRMIQSNVCARWLLLRLRFVMRETETHRYISSRREPCALPLHKPNAETHACVYSVTGEKENATSREHRREKEEERRRENCTLASRNIRLRELYRLTISF